MDSTGKVIGDAADTTSDTSAKGATEDSKDSLPAAGAGEEDAAARQRRKEKIMQSREDRLAKILSMASGRTVDPKEVHLERTPSPTVSEVAAAGVGPALKVPASDAASMSSSSPVSPLRTHTRRGLARIALSQKGRHTIVMVLAAVLFTVWSVYWNGTRLSSAFEPWQVALSVFFVIQSVEYTTGRLHPRGLLSDSALFGFVVLVVSKLLARHVG